MNERAITYVENVYLHEKHQEDLPYLDGWEVHVRRPDSEIDIYYAVVDQDGWLVKQFQGDTTWCSDLGHVMLHVLGSSTEDTLPPYRKFVTEKE